MKDLNSDGVLDTLLYLTGDKPDNLIVDWTDSDSPEVMLNLQLGDDVTDRWGNIYTDIIEEIDYFDLKQQFADDVDSLVTLLLEKKLATLMPLGHLFLQMIITSLNQNGQKQQVARQKGFTTIIFFTNQGI